MTKYLKKGSIKSWKAFLLFQVVGWLAVLMFLTLISIVVPKLILWFLICIIAIPYVFFAAIVLWVNTGNPKLSVISALAKLWCLLYILYGIAVVVRMGLIA